MNLIMLLKNWKDCVSRCRINGSDKLSLIGTTSAIWGVIQPFVMKLVWKKVPSSITRLYENLARYTQPAIDSLQKLKVKIKNSPNELDDYCFEQGVGAIEHFAYYLLEVVEDLRK